MACEEAPFVPILFCLLSSRWTTTIIIMPQGWRHTTTTMPMFPAFLLTSITDNQQRSMRRHTNEGGRRSCSQRQSFGGTMGGAGGQLFYNDSDYPPYLQQFHFHDPRAVRPSTLVVYRDSKVSWGFSIHCIQPANQVDLPSQSTDSRNIPYVR